MKKQKDKRKYMFSIGKLRFFPFFGLKYMTASLLLIALAITFCIGNNLKLFDKYIEKSDWGTENSKYIYLLATKYVYSPYVEKLAKKNGTEETLNFLRNKFNPISLDYPLLKTEKPVLDKNKKTIVVLGDSLVWGLGLTNSNLTFRSQLEVELLRRGYSCEVIGVGFGGLNSLDELEIITKSSMIDDLSPDILIIGYFQNDYYIEGNDYVHADFDSKALSLYEKKIVKPLKEYSEQLTFPIVVQTLPTEPKWYYRNCYEPIVTLYRDYGINAYDCTEDFINNFHDDVHKDNYAVNPKDGHPGTATSYFYAQYIADWLENDYPNILGKKVDLTNKSYDIEINDWLPGILNVKPTDKKENSVTYTITYPKEVKENSSSSEFLYMPIMKNYVQLSFKYPVDISKITITGDKLISSELRFTARNEQLGYDDRTVYDLGERKGSSCVFFEPSGKYATSLLLSAEILNGESAELKVKIDCKKGGVKP